MTAGLLHASIFGAALLLTIELIKSHRSNFWIGVNAEGWQGAAIAFVIYLTAFFAIALTVNAPLLQLLRRKQSLRTGIATTVSATYIVAFLSQFSQSYLDIVGVGGVVLLLGMLALNTLSERRGWVPKNGILTLAIVACVISWIAMETIGTLNIVHADRHALITIVPLVAAVIAFEIGFALMIRTPLKWCGAIPYALLALSAASLFSIAYRADTQHAARTPDQPSILLVTCDALRADYLSVYGGHLDTPNFERVQNQGVTFQKAYALAPWTLPSVNALYGSQYPLGLTPGAPFEQWRHEVTAYTFDDKQHTLAQRLSDAGYATALFTGNGLVGQAESTRRGFDSFVRLGHHLEGWTRRWAYVPYFRELLVEFIPRLAAIRPVDTTKVLTAYANGFIETHRGRPVFIWLHYMDPHSPYDPPDAFRTEEGPWPLFCPRNPHWGTPQHTADASLELTPKEMAYTQTLYEGEIRYVDDALGKVLATMNRTGHDQNAIICLTADHGEEMWDHGKWGHGHSLYDEVIRVPLLLSAPGLPQQRIDEPISHIDLIPTLADLAHIDADPNWQGQSLTPRLLDRAAPASRPAFARATNTLNPVEPLEMVVVQDHKLIRGRESGAIQLLDLSKEPELQQTISPSNNKIAGALMYNLQLWNKVFSPSFSTNATVLNKAVLEELQALGYVN